MFEFILQFSASATTDGCIYVLIGLGLVIIYRSPEVMYFAQGTIAMAGGVTRLFGKRNDKGGQGRG